MILLRDIKLKINHSEQDLYKKIVESCKLKGYGGKASFEYSIVRQSIDARKKPDIFYIYTVNLDFGINENKVISYLKKKHINNINYEPQGEYEIPQNGANKLTKRPVIVGAGPAGLFAAYLLAQKGFKPLVFERGECVSDRVNTVNSTFETGIVNPESNVQFGEGGAGTFSDGKLNTLTKDVNGRNTYVLKTFAKFGAPDKITYVAKPHIGTDLLTGIIANLRNEIISLGGEFYFSTKITDFNIKDKKIIGVSAVNCKNGKVFEVATDTCILCIGHSARDTFEVLYSKNIDMSAKSFAVGYRMAHPQSYVNMWQYGVEDTHEIGLEAADYKVANETSNGRRVYSFCMCPGGYVVNASSEEGRLCVNGMSESGRDSDFANSAIICAITPDDFVQDTVDDNHPLRGMYYQRNIEEKAFTCGRGLIPAQYFIDFENNSASESIQFGRTKGNVSPANLRTILSDDINNAIIESVHKFGYTRKGFDDDKAIMYGVEARTSSPVRINRNDMYESNIAGIYPCGEGAGYAGGITSAATDGIKVAERIISMYYPDY